MKFQNTYSFFDRVLHRLAFFSKKAQISFSEIEDQIYQKELKKIQEQSPVFITALPRAGTTLFLELLASQEEFISHSYRDMPFLFAPLLWRKFSSPFKTSGLTQERAHEDGMQINIDSPEAFEEMLWEEFWPNHYQKDQITPWKLDETDEKDFFDFFNKHMRKMSLLAQEQKGSVCRYVSKNNLNIARLELLKKKFPDSSIMVLFRDPIQQAQSLLNQHLNFLKIHQEDKFARVYMKEIGHFDFGENFRPINFDGWLDQAYSKDTQTLSFWLEYWNAAYGGMIKNETRDGSTYWISYDAFCQDPEKGLRALGEILKVKNLSCLLNQKKKIQSLRFRDCDLTQISPSILDRTHTLFLKLNRIKLF